MQAVFHTIDMTTITLDKYCRLLNDDLVNIYRSIGMDLFAHSHVQLRSRQFYTV